MSALRLILDGIVALGFLMAAGALVGNMGMARDKMRKAGMSAIDSFWAATMFGVLLLCGIGAVLGFLALLGLLYRWVTGT